MEVLMLEGYRRFSDQASAEIGCAPNVLLYNAADRKGALAVKRGRLGDFPLGRNGLAHLKKGLDAGRISEGLVILIGSQGEIIARAPVDDVVSAIGSAPALPGANGWGPYWWLSADFKLANQDRPF
jgi:hypothetical protein